LKRSFENKLELDEKIVAPPTCMHRELAVAAAATDVLIRGLI
jgi:hypothetical protein